VHYVLEIERGENRWVDNRAETWPHAFAKERELIEIKRELNDARDNMLRSQPINGTWISD
jgi:hypothetical protein